MQLSNVQWTNAFKVDPCRILKKNRAEVIAVSIFEYDKEEEEKKPARQNMRQGMMMERN